MPQQIFLGTLVQSTVIITASLIGGKVPDRTGRRKVFVLTASVVYGLALFVVAIASNFNGFLVGMAISGLGVGVYLAVDLALVVDLVDQQRQLRRAVHGRRAVRHHRGLHHPARAELVIQARGSRPSSAAR